MFMPAQVLQTPQSQLPVCQVSKFLKSNQQPSTKQDKYCS